MKDSRGGKRRRISDAPTVDEDGDIAMHEGSPDLHPKATALPAVQKETTAISTPKPRSPKQQQKITSDDSDKIPTDKLEDVAETPVRTGLRSSGRQRKAPQRFEDDINHIKPARKSTHTPGRKGPTQRSARKTSQDPEDDSNERSPPSPVERVTRTRSRKATVRFNGIDDAGNQNSSTKVAESHQPISADDYLDGLDDLVSMQLQQDLTQEGLSEMSETLVAGDALPSYAKQFQTLLYGGFTEELQILSKIIVEKLSGKRLVPLRGVQSEYCKVNQLIEQTVTVGEGNSMLLLGSRGSGKTAIVETILASLKEEHMNDFHVVRLNGFLHTDDRLALREIWRQLGRETNTEEEAGKVSSYADTMATLLALLSHPEELFAPSGDQNTITTAKSIVIILDEFDLFVTHPRQTLLYNLFDIAQARKAPIAVLGLSTKVDVTEMLEKRVKSRFSHRSVYIPLPRTLEVFSDICFAGLNLEDAEIWGPSETLHVEGKVVIKSERWDRLLKGWRSFVKGLWADATFQTHLRMIYNQTKSVREFFSSALTGMTEMHHSTCSTTSNDASLIHIPTPATFTDNHLSCPDPAPLPFSISTTVSASPSSLPLSLLLAATRLTALYDPGIDASLTQDLAPLALSFPAAYAEYVRLLTSAKTSASVSGATVTPGRVWGRDVAREAWEKLVSWGLVSPVGGGSGTADGRMFRIEVSFEEVVEMAGSGGSLGRWWRDA